MSNIPYVLDRRELEATGITDEGTMLFITDKPFVFYHLTYAHSRAVEKPTLKHVENVYKSIQDGVLYMLIDSVEGLLELPVKVVIDLRTTKTITPQVEELLKICGYKVEDVDDHFMTVYWLNEALADRLYANIKTSIVSRIHPRDANRTNHD